MKVFILATICVAAALAAPAKVSLSGRTFNFEFDDEWVSFKKEHNKSYSKHEEAVRYQAFQDNKAWVADNKDSFNFEIGLNEFSDLSSEEFARMYTGRIPLRKDESNVEILAVEAAADEVDWRAKGAVTPVKNQGQCGSCWSFSTTGSIEGRVQIATGTLTSLSEQQLMDCSVSEGNHGCNGGLMDYAFEYVIKNGGLDTEEDYPYEMKDGTCNKVKAAKTHSDISSYKDVASRNEDQLKAAVSEGPVSVAIEADQRAFQMYRSGVFDASCGTQLDHGVLVVGYTSDAWIVKNSWGSTWGDEGYIMMKMGVGESGICGIAMQPSYPIASSTEAAPSNGDYEDPGATGSCSAGEEALQITGVKGAFCSPSCSTSSPCPPAPSGATATPQCALEKAGTSQPTNCALICSPGADDDQCPGTSTCKAIQTVGVCTYDS